MENKGKFYLTTAIPYASGKPHIGNVYDIVASDAIARFKREQGYDVYFVTGTDEHGQKVEDLAAAKGVSPKEYVDEVVAVIKDIWALMGASYDKFIRTTDEEHVKCIQKIFTKLYEQGDIYKTTYDGLYCVPCESYFTETQAPDGICPDCGRPLVHSSEEAYKFRMSKYQERIEKFYEECPDFAVPESRKKEMINNFIKPGIQDLCVTRSTIKWGVPVPFDPKHVVYVWLDALPNYISALGYDPENPSELYKKYWPCDLHVIGKDIIRFHMIYWPAFLMALGEPVPKKIFAHPWILFGGDKMSKSKGNIIYPDDAVNYFGLDAVRYYLLAETPYASDGSITYESVISVFNTDLANTLGNLVSRTVSMTKKYFGGVIPAPAEKGERDDELIAAAKAAYEGFTENMESYHIADAIASVFDLLRRANKYVDETTPWSLAKDESKADRLKTVIYNLLESLRISAVLLAPVMPETCEKILHAINAENTGIECAATFGGLEAGKEVNDVGVLFARIDEAKMLERIAADNEARKAASAK